MEEKKKGKGLVVALVIIIILLVAVLAVCVTLLLTTNKEEPKIDNKQPIEEKYTDLELDDSLVQDANKIIPNYMCGGLAITLKEKDMKIDDFSDNEKFNMVTALYFDKLIDSSGNNSSFTFKEEELNKYFANLKFMDSFKPGIDTGTDVNGKTIHEGTKFIDETIYPFYMTYKDGVYTMGGYGTGCAGPSNEGYKLYMEKAKKNSSQLIINYARYYEKPEMDESTDTFYYEAYNHKGDKDVVSKVEYSENGTKIDTSKLDHYDFIYNIKDNNIRLEKIKYYES